MADIVNLEIQLLTTDATLPEYHTIHSSGFDLCSAENTTLQTGECKLISTGIKMAIPVGYEAQIRPRSGLSLKKNIIVPNSPGTIDADYRGEVKIILSNIGKKDFKIEKGDRIAQCVICPVVQAKLIVKDSLSDTKRGEGGFGHTGIRTKK